ncbi:30S ribosomal protein S4 [Candidatus Woesearchaeota archaeon]|nr:30S ribosomal protein S4 [Candidatus Woesearchaeota archaeon]
MGDPGKIRKKYDTPSHPWQSARILEEKKIISEYGLKNKKDIWKMETLLRDLKNQAKSLASRVDEQSKLEEKQLIDRLVSMGLIQATDSMDKVLGLTLKDVMDRRLQTFIVKKGLARTMKQARQFITHGHVIVGKKKITFPNYFVTLKDESLVEFIPKSALAREDHPERIIVDKDDNKGKEKKKKKDSEEALPAFSQDAIESIEEKGAVDAATEEESEE